MILLILGLIVLLAVQADFVITVLSGGRQGPLTEHLTSAFWRLEQKLHRWRGGGFFHAHSGILVMVAVALAWLLLTSLGWLLIYRSDPTSLVVSETGKPADWVQSFAYVGSALSTMGAANTSASNGWWDLIATVAAANGFVLLTLAMTYVLNVTQTVASGRSFALLVSSLDPTDPRHTDTFATGLSRLVAQLSSTPLALYFSSRDPNLRLARAIGRFSQRVSASPELWPCFAASLRALPGIKLDGMAQSDEAEVERWVEHFSLNRNELD
ncbi:hypothetical protein [Devosia sp. RR2S18]|uniref:hypothetical protein n=1 Tax=Devosia rhizosphaerae TaxID=3049774 RepID=UPI0025422E1D|nr:hypothetical protein [Devosia sp. RR2S18]WIJ25213.1 hypothetical protein QOV41_00080 [Devosia sp. RR2S18]